MCSSLLEISESQDPDGALRVALSGELDLSATDRLSARLSQLRRSQRRVRLDLSALQFIDCSGMGVIVSALARSRTDGATLEVDRRVSPLAERIFALAQIESALWPTSDGVGQVGRASTVSADADRHP